MMTTSAQFLLQISESDMRNYTLIGESMAKALERADWDLLPTALELTENLCRIQCNHFGSCFYLSPTWSVSLSHLSCSAVQT